MLGDRKVKPKVESTGPLIVRGVPAVDPQRCPTLHRALTRMLERQREQGDWSRVVELRAKGDLDAADRVARRAMGIMPEPMSEEAKEKLRLYREEHVEEIKDRAKLKRTIRARTRAIMVAPKRRRNK